MAQGVEERLAVFLQRYVGRPFAWGDDCGLFLADWWLECHGVDPAATLRGTYGTEQDKIALLEARGGILKVVSGCATAVGAKRTRQIVPGCFGVIRPGIGAIRSTGYWVVRSPAGIAFLKEAVAWRVWSI